MQYPIKSTKYILITSIIALFLLGSITSCKRSNQSPSKSSSSSKKTSSLKPSSSNGNVDKVLKTAKSYIGTKYKFGGMSRNGMDCSGLVYTSFKSVNIQLPRTSGEQSKSGKSVSIKDLKPGDLVFFTDRKGNKKITHVGIVTEIKSSKNIRFIHASTKLGVVEDNLYADYYLNIFIKATRVL